MKSDAFSMTLLFDHYGALLTEKQQTYFDLYYEQDFSLAEIAQEEGVSRQAVHDTLTRTEAALRHFEEKLGMVARSRQRRAAAETLEKAALQMEEGELRRTILDAIGTIKE